MENCTKVARICTQLPRICRKVAENCSELPYKYSQIVGNYNYKSAEVEVQRFYLFKRYNH
jgi:hypothetical protein